MKNLSTLKYILPCLVILILALGPPDQAHGQSETSRISGRVVDARTGEPIIGANVALTGTTRGAATDLDGQYSIREVPAGHHSITVSYISYARKTITDVQVNADSNTRLNVSLMPETVGMEAVTVTAAASSNSEAGLLSIQRKSVSFQDGLSSEFLDKSGAGDVASGLKKITGVSLMNGKEVFVRGLGNRYSNVQLNGAQVPSTNPNKKEAPVDLVGSSLVDHIVVQKTYTPDQSGEFSGGSVQITTKEFPEDRNLSLSYSTSFNTRGTFGNTLTYPGSRTDFLGFDNGKRALPASITDNRLTREQEVETAAKLHNDWSVRNSSQAIPSQKIGVSYANQFNEEAMPVGIVSNISYKYHTAYDAGKITRSIESTNRNTGENILSGDFVQDVGTESSDFSAMMNLFVKPGRTTKIGFKNLYSNALENKTSVVTGTYTNALRINRQTILDFDRRNIYSSSVNAEKYFSDFLQSSLSAVVSYSRALRDRPDRRTTQYALNDDRQYAIKLSEGGNGHFYSSQNDKNYSARIDYELEPVNGFKLKTGVTGNFKERAFEARKLEYQDFENSVPSDLAIAPPEEVLADKVIAEDIIDLAEITGPNDSYEGEQLLYAGYLSSTLDILARLSLDVGARIESSDQRIDGRSLVQTTDILPSINATYNISDKTNLRGAFSVTLARPEFREISEFDFQDFVGSRIVYGNPDLERTNINNYDLRFETYPHPGELFAVSAFYKQFHNPIEVWYRITERTEVVYENADRADLYGLELEMRKNFTERLQFVANGSYIFSKVDFSDSREEIQGRLATFERPMYGQSPYTVNLSAFYALPAIRTELGMNYHTFGKRIVTIGKGTHPDDEYEQPFHGLNMNISHTLGDYSFSLGVENLLNDQRVYKQGRVTTFQYKPGMTYTFGVKVAL
ncbi:TonB-dependent receptor [Fodinibius sediminis]|uniref:TonB-dependent receptor n=1 Tax=Fodinibius sediminis TaxID=1214077 RepID=A0A521B922_9BACT|nr:TonB-dependent receptor [Fodinibius sediminis]SMO43579.1 TonB-dependent receptor [Fodinibius sediminis]